MMAVEAETGQLVANKINNFKFSLEIWTILKFCKRKVDKLISAKWQAYFNRACLNEYIYIYISFKQAPLKIVDHLAFSSFRNELSRCRATEGGQRVTILLFSIYCGLTAVSNKTIIIRAQN